VLHNNDALAKTPQKKKGLCPKLGSSEAKKMGLLIFAIIAESKQ
jgi:hypothetical protein